MRTPLYLAVLATLSLAAGAHAQSTPAPTATERDVTQQQRIESGLQSGQLNTHEAARLESGAAKVDRMQGRAMRDGTVTSAEAAKIGKAQNAESAAIARQKHDAQKGNPASASSQRMQADVQRNANQQARINAGVANGSLTTAEAGKLEHGQARNSRKQAVAGADGHVSAGEQARVARGQDAQSARIHRKKHNEVAAN